MTTTPWSGHIEELADQSRLRGTISEFLRRHEAAPGDCRNDQFIGDALIVVTELVTNAFQHGKAEFVTVAVSVSQMEGTSGTDVTLEIGYHPPDDQMFNPRAEMPNPTELRGRGLAMVAALVDHHDVAYVNGVRYDRANMTWH